MGLYCLIMWPTEPSVYIQRKLERIAEAGTLKKLELLPP